MALDPGLVGRSYPPSAVYEVGRAKIAEFAGAIGDPDPVYRDADAARAAGHPDVIAPPTFAIVVSLEAATSELDDPDVALDYSRVVHGEQRFAHHRPIRAGDRLVATTTIDAVRSVGGNDLLTTRVDLATEDGEPVSTATSPLVARGGAGGPPRSRPARSCPSRPSPSPAPTWSATPAPPGTSIPSTGARGWP